LELTAKRIKELDVNVSVSYLKTSRYLTIPALRDDPGLLLQTKCLSTEWSTPPSTCNIIEVFLNKTFPESCSGRGRPM